MTESWSQSPRKLSLISDKSQVHGYELQNCWAICVKGSNHRSVSGLHMTVGKGHHQQSENCFCESTARPWPAAGGWVRKVNICFNNWPCTFTTSGNHQGQRLATLERWCDSINKNCSVSSGVEKVPCQAMTGLIISSKSTHVLPCYLFV